jgi:hypothetical protein
MTWRASVLLLASCGRLDFDSRSHDAGSGDAAAPALALLQDDANDIYLGPTSASLSFIRAPTPGSLVWVSVVSADSHTIDGVTDNQGNSYTLALTAQTPGCLTISVYGFFAANVTSSGTFTVTATGGAVWGLHLREYSGALHLDQNNAGLGLGALGDSGAVQVSVPGSLAIGVQTHCQTLTSGAGTGWANHVVTTENQAYQAFSTEDMIDPAPGAYDATFTYTPAEVYGWAVGVAVLAP